MWMRLIGRGENFMDTSENTASWRQATALLWDGSIMRVFGSKSYDLGRMARTRKREKLLLN